MMSIGEFALHTGISVKALRFYDERGILPPAEVEPASGYRFYAAGQLRVATTVRVLRAAGMSLESVAQVLDEPDRATDVLAGHQERLRAKRALEDRAIHIAEGVLAEAEAPAQIQTRQVGSTHWAAVATTVGVEDETTGGTDRVNSRFELLHTALSQAGNPPIGGGWTTMAPTVGSGEVEVLLSWPVRKPVPEDFSIEGVELRTGTLPDRTEVFVRMEVKDIEEDLLDDTPGGRLLHPSYLAFVDFLEQNGHEPREMRQVNVLDDDGTPSAMELTATIVP